MKKLFRKTFTLKETRCKIAADQKSGIITAVKSIKHHREQLEQYGKEKPKFFWSLKPVPIPQQPLVAKLMAEAAASAKVGPMAAVAGVLADLAVKDMLADGCKTAIVENGGEVSAVSDEPVDVAFAAGDEPLSKKFCFRLTEFPAGIGTSSGRFSHALSFGDAEAATVFCKTAGLADAAATAVCNVIKGDNVEEAITRGIEVAKTIRGVEGVFILYRNGVGTWGKVPEFVKIKP
ncbi:MAG: UPF0280 family protein [Candidatus Bathyarchaeota archaeon]|nr:UPF0280 family protein [Candidatus Bathyarchaeota archaeon]